jgi:pyruvate dehydrogenase complex dehydrogenase (E1) component
MNTVARAWEAAMLALTEARDLHAQGGDVDTLRDLLQHAREMMDVIEDEIAQKQDQVTDADTMRMAAAELRKRVEALAATLLPLH